MKNITISIIQFERSKMSPEYNLEAMREYLRGVKKESDIVLMPEDWLGTKVFSMPTYVGILEKLVEELPHEDCLLVAGAHYVSVGDLVFSRGAFVLPRELNVEYFEKQFPSNAVNERKFISRGGPLSVITHKGVKMGGVVCVDLFYPEVVRGLALRNAQLVFNPANITKDRISLWHKLGVARACENTVFIAMANNTNTAYPDGRKVSGESFIAFPCTDSISSCGSRPGVFQFSIDLSEIVRARKRWRYLEDIIEEKERMEKWYLR